MELDDLIEKIYSESESSQVYFLTLKQLIEVVPIGKEELLKLLKKCRQHSNTLKDFKKCVLPKLKPIDTNKP